VRRRGLDSSDSIETSGGTSEHDNETSGSIKGGEFLGQMSDYWLLKKDSTPWR
jgi:hypothetical protein